jgi:segregation and condensation protein A
MQRIHQIVTDNKTVELQSLFQVRAHKSTLVAMFLATLELTRHHGMLAEQDEQTGLIWLKPGEHFKEFLEVAEVENLSNQKMASSNMHIPGR